jgi:hypothetical protein
MSGALAASARPVSAVSATPAVATRVGPKLAPPLAAAPRPGRPLPAGRSARVWYLRAKYTYNKYIDEAEDKKLVKDRGLNTARL